MCKYTFDDQPSQSDGLAGTPAFDWLEKVKLVGYGVDTLVLNVRYMSDTFQSTVKCELDADLAHALDELQCRAKQDETAVPSSWSFLGKTVFVEPYGAGRQWRWLLKAPLEHPLLSLVISRGTFNNIVAQVRFSSEYLWSQGNCAEALVNVHAFLISIFGQQIGLQVSSVDLCADVMGYDFSLANYQHHFITRARKESLVYGADALNLDYKSVSYLRFSSNAAPISCRIYNKTLEIKQKSGKTWCYDFWRHGVPGPFGGSWDGSSEVWRIEAHLNREFLRNLVAPVNGAYDLLDQFVPLWSYAVGQPAGGADGLPEGWLRYVTPNGDTNVSRWPVHPVWRVVQSAFHEPVDAPLGPVVRERVREKNVERGLAAIVGYSSTLAAWLGGEYAEPGTDLSHVLHWLAEQGPEYLEKKKRDFSEEVTEKQRRYGHEE